MTAKITALIAVALLLAAGAVAVDAAFVDAGDHVTVDNESFTPSSGPNQLSDSELDNVTYDEEHDIQVFNNSSTVDADGNWSWIRANGTVDVVKDSFLDNRSSANVTYGYSQSGPTERQLATLFGNGLEVAQIFIFVLGVAVILAGARILGGVG